MVCCGEEKKKADYIIPAFRCFSVAFREEVAWRERGFVNLTRTVLKEEGVVT